MTKIAGGAPWPGNAGASRATYQSRHSSR